MKSEFNRVSPEYHRTTEDHIPQDPDRISFEEVAVPLDEFAPPAEEFPGMEETAAQESGAQRPGKREKVSKQIRKRLTRQMSYLVASVVAVATISSTLGGGSIVDNVISLGGSTRGDLRFSIQWNDRDYNPNDFDAHCIEPGGHVIYFGNAGQESPSGGTLDVDIVFPEQGNTAVENIIYPSRSQMEDGVYRLRVHCFSQNGGRSGFSAEVAIRGRVYHFRYPHSLSQDEYIDVANVTVSNGRITLERLMDS